MRAIPCVMAFVLTCVLSGCTSLEKDWHVGTDREVSVGGVMVEARSTNALVVEGNWTQSLIFMGMDAAGTATVEYRETSGGYARPAFTERYQLAADASRHVTVKNFELEVIAATAAKLRFRVIRDDVQTRKDYDTPAPAPKS